MKVRTYRHNEKIKYASAHDLRRSFGERWASRVMPETLMELMRHESIETTMKYYVGRNAQRTAETIWRSWQAETKSNTSGNTAPVESDRVVPADVAKLYTDSTS